MSYLTQNEIASNAAMQHRVAQCAAREGMNEGVDPDRWTVEQRRTWAAAPGWDEAWEYALATHPAPELPPPGYLPFNPGADEAVITDGQILAQVQSMLP